MLQMTKHDEDVNRVTIHFDRGHPSVRAKVLVGADGYFSRIRKQCLNDGPPLFAVSTASAAIQMAQLLLCTDLHTDSKRATSKLDVKLAGLPLTLLLLLPVEKLPAWQG